MTQKEALIIMNLIEYITKTLNGWRHIQGWRRIQSALKEQYLHNGQEVVEAIGALAKLAHRSNPLSIEDFDT